MRKEISIMLSVLIIGLLGVIIIATPASAVPPVPTPTWDPTLHWDFEDHTNTHAHLSQLTAEQIGLELQAVDAAFTAHNYAAPAHLAYPYGDYGKNGRNQAKVKGAVALYRDSARVVFGDMMAYPVADWYVVKAAQLKAKTGWRIIQGWVDECIATDSLLHIFTHDISDKPSSYGVTPAMLTRLLDYLVDQQTKDNLQVMPMAQAYDIWSTATTNPQATVVISFDDAYESDYTVAYQLFKTRALIGTSYIVTSFIGQPGQLTWAEIDAMRTGA